MAEMHNKMLCSPESLPHELRAAMQENSISVIRGIISLTPVGSLLKQLCEEG